MLKISKISLFFVVFVAFFSCYFAAPNFFKKNVKFLPKAKLNFGIDLKGGSFITMQVDFDSYMSDCFDNLIDDIKDVFKNSGVLYKNIFKKNKNTLSVILYDDFSDDFAIKNALKKIDKNYDINLNRGVIDISAKKSFIKNLRHNVLIDSIKNVRKRIDSMGIGEISVQIKGSDSILLQIPDSENVDKIKKIISTTSKMTFHLLCNNEDNKKNNSYVPYITLYSKNGKKYNVCKKVEIDGNLLKHVTVSYDSRNNPAVAFAFNAIGTKKFAALTRQNVGRALVIVIDNMIMSAPIIKESIAGGRGEITGDFSVDEASELAITLRSGALPASMKVVGEKFIGPTLGEESIVAGKNSMIVSFIAVSFVMSYFYRMFGVLSVIALFFNMTMILGLLTIFGAVLTLPGIAGIVLTIGMAVDGNIIIFERINDEIKAGKKKGRAVFDGFANAVTTIVDSNLTTLISAFILFLFGSGPIKGFSVTLGIGIITTLFSNIVVNKILVYSWVNFVKNKAIKA